MFNYLLFVLLCICSSLTLAAPKPYWNIDEFFAQNPAQRELTEGFSSLVRNPAMPLQQKQDQPVRIYILYPGKQVSDYWRRSVKSFTARMDELGIKYEIKQHHTKPAVALKQQAKLLNRAKLFNPDYVIFTLDAVTHQPLAEAIMQQGNTKLILQNITTPIKQWRGRKPFIYVGFDHIQGTRMLSDFFSRKVAGNGGYAVVYWSKGYISEVRGDSFIKMQQQNSLNLAEARHTNASRRSAYQASMEILSQRPNLKFIYACATDVALGVSNAIRDNGLQGQVLVNGWGGGSKELEAIQRKELDVTVMRMNDDNGVAMAEAIKLDLQGKPERVPTLYSGDFVLVTKETSKSELKLLKQRAFRYSSQ